MAATRRPMDILTIDTNNRRAVQRFLDFPFQLYRHTPQWVPPFASDAGMMLDRKSTRSTGIRRRSSSSP